MNRMRRAKLYAMPLKKLRELRDDVQTVITDIESQRDRRDIDIASEFRGEPEFVAEVLRASGNKESGKWEQLEKIYCSRERCSRCPHGPFFFTYRRIKSSGKLKVKYSGKPVFNFNPDDWGTLFRPKAGVKGYLVEDRTEGQGRGECQ